MKIKRNSYWVYFVDVLVTIFKAIGWAIIFLAFTATFAYLLLVHVRWF